MPERPQLLEAVAAMDDAQLKPEKAGKLPFKEPRRLNNCLKIMVSYSHYRRCILYRNLLTEIGLFFLIQLWYPIPQYSGPDQG